MNIDYNALIGGILIGLSSSVMLLVNGKITGISGIFANGFLNKFSEENIWKILFTLGLVIGGAVMMLINPSYFSLKLSAPVVIIIIAGLLVGLGTRLGSGCTSGHGVCGLGRRSLRSLFATINFILFGVLTVYIKGLLS